MITQNGLDTIQALCVSALKNVERHLPPNVPTSLIKADWERYDGVIDGLFEGLNVAVCALCGKKYERLDELDNLFYGFVNARNENSSATIPSVEPFLDFVKEYTK